MELPADLMSRMQAFPASNNGNVKSNESDLSMNDIAEPGTLTKSLAKIASLKSKATGMKETTQFDHAEALREEDEKIQPLEKFRQMYIQFEDENYVDVGTLSDLFEVKMVTKSTTNATVWRLLWVTISPDDCKMCIYKNSLETELVASIYLGGCSVTQVLRGLPPDEASIFRVSNIRLWSKGIFIENGEPCEWHMCAQDDQQAYEWVQMIHANIKFVLQHNEKDMINNFIAGQGLQRAHTDPVLQEMVGSEAWGWGDNTCGQLGIGCNRSRHSPDEISQLHTKGVACMSVGTSHVMLASRIYGELLAFGSNEYGQLGTMSSMFANVPTRVSDPEVPPDRRLTNEVHFFGQVKSLAAGVGHSLILTEAGDVYSVGTNSHGQLGLGHACQLGSPHKAQLVPVLQGQQCKLVAAGTHSVALAGRFDEVFAWGSNSHGQLGLGHNSWQAIPQRVNALCRRRVKSISCGYSHTLVSTSTDEVFGFGCNSSGQLGLGHMDPVYEPAKVAALCQQRLTHLALGGHHSVAVTQMGSLLMSCGCNNHGQLGLGLGSTTTEYKVTLDALQSRAHRQYLGSCRQMTALQNHEGSWSLDCSTAEILNEALRLVVEKSVSDLRDAKPSWSYMSRHPDPPRSASSHGGSTIGEPIGGQHLDEDEENDEDEDGLNASNPLSDKVWATALVLSYLKFTEPPGEPGAVAVVPDHVVKAAELAARWLHAEEARLTAPVPFQIVLAHARALVEIWASLHPSDKPAPAFKNFSTPQIVPLLSNLPDGDGRVQQVSCGDHHTVVVTGTGTGTESSRVWAFGSNGYGQFGDGGKPSWHNALPQELGSVSKLFNDLQRQGGLGTTKLVAGGNSTYCFSTLGSRDRARAPLSSMCVQPRQEKVRKSVGVKK